MAPTVLIAAVCDQTLCICSTWSRLTEGHNRGLVDADGDAALDCVDSLSITWFTRAALDVVHNNTLGVGSTWVGLALLQRSGTWDGRRIALIPGQTVTDWSVSNHSTARVWPTLVTSALGSILDTSDKRIASLASGTGADGIAIVQFTHSPSSTR